VAETDSRIRILENPGVIGTTMSDCITGRCELPGIKRTTKPNDSTHQYTAHSRKTFFPGQAKIAQYNQSKFRTLGSGFPTP